MPKETDKREDRHRGSSQQKGQNKIGRDKVTAFFFVSAYDLVTWVGIALCVGLVLIYGFQKNWRGFWWSLLALLILIVIMLAIRAKQHFWGEDVPSHAERPSLFVERVVARPLVAGHRKAVSVQLRNSGSKPARRITVWINQAFTKADFAGPLKFARIHEPDTRFDCEPTATVSLAGKSDSPVALWEIKALNDGKAFWFHYGKGTYEDDDGNSYPLSFCYMYDPGIEDMRICPDRFWPKDDASPMPVPRPNLTTKGAQARFRVDGPEDITVAITNLGDLTATKLWLDGITVVTPPDFKGPLRKEGSIRHECPTEIIPGATISTVLRGNKRWTKSGVESVRSGKNLLFHYCEGGYEDGAGNSYPFAFCFKYEPGFPVMSLCEKCYWPKPESA